MAADWDVVPLGDVVTLQRGFDLPTQDRQPGTVPIVSSSGITGTHSEARVKGPGVVTGRYGTIGEVFYISEDFWPLNTTLYVRDFKGNDPLFVSYLLRTIDYGAHNDKSSVPGVNRNHLHTVPVLRPPLPEQRAIAHILGTLDDKIELNRRMSETLEGMARALFKSWFVDFDPVRAKAEAGDSRLRKPFADLFPSRLVDSELGEIPEGWEVRSIGDLLELSYGKALKDEKRQHGSIPVFGSNGQIGWHNERLAPGPGIVVGRKGNPGVVTWAAKDFFVIDTAFYVAPKLSGQSLHFLLHALRSHDFAALGTDSAVPGLNRNIAYMSQQLVPTQPLLDRFDRIARCLAERAHGLEEESRTLSALRDALLPKLMSGEIRVGELPAARHAR